MSTPFTRDQLSPQMRQRYGLDRRPIGRWIAVTLLVLAFVVIMVVVAFGVTGSPIDARLVTWRPISADHAELSIQVKRPADREATCVVRAQDDQRIDVGYATLVIPPGSADIVVDYPLRTLAPAGSAELLGCSLDGSPSVPPPQFPPGVVPPQQPWS